MSRDPIWDADPITHKLPVRKQDNILAEVAAIRCGTDGLKPSKVITHSHAFSLLEINEQAFDEIKHKLELAGVLDTFYDSEDETLILPGIALAAQQKEPAK